MAITYPLTAPVSSVGIATFNISGETVSAISQSPTSFAQQIFKWSGERWKAGIQLAPMLRQDAEVWTSFLLSLKGRFGTFLLGDPGGSQPRGAVVRRNLLLYTEDFSNAYWTKTNSTIASTAVTNPVSGVASGVWNLVENTDVSLTHGVSRSFANFVAGQTYVVSVYAKQGVGRDISVQLSGVSAFTTSQLVRFNLTTGATTVSSGTPVPTMTAVSGGFYRCSFTAVAITSGSSSVTVFLVNGNTNLYNGDGTSFAVISDIQMEAASTPTNYQKTIGAWGSTPLVNGASQVGSSLIINNLNQSVNGVFLAGDYIQLGSGSTSTLLKVLTTTDSDSAGAATLDVFPAIRTAPLSGATVTVQNSVGRWRLDTDLTSWEINNLSSYGINFNCVEAIG